MFGESIHDKRMLRRNYLLTAQSERLTGTRVTTMVRIARNGDRFDVYKLWGRALGSRSIAPPLPQNLL